MRRVSPRKRKSGINSQSKHCSKSFASTLDFASAVQKTTLSKARFMSHFRPKRSSIVFLALEEKPACDGKELHFERMVDYVARKNEDIKEGRLEPQKSYDSRRGGGPRFRGRGRGRDSDRGNRRDDRDPDDWKKRRDNDQASGHRNRNDKRGRGGRGGRGGRDGPGGNRRGGGRDKRDRNDDRNRERKDDG